MNERVQTKIRTFSTISVFGRELYKTNVFEAFGEKKEFIWHQRLVFYDVTIDSESRVEMLKLAVFNEGGEGNNEYQVFHYMAEISVVPKILSKLLAWDIEVPCPKCLNCTVVSPVISHQSISHRSSITFSRQSQSPVYMYQLSIASHLSQ